MWISRTIGPPKGRWKYGGRTNVLAYLPQWLIVPITALLPGSWMVARIRGGTQKQRRKRLGLCPHCGYDLRATPDRCPECGTEGEMQKSECWKCRIEEGSVTLSRPLDALTFSPKPSPL